MNITVISKTKIYIVHDFQGTVISLYRRSISTGQRRPPVNVGVCVRTLYGHLDSYDIDDCEEDRTLLGTCAAILVLPVVKQMTSVSFLVETNA